jgi:hypothetical protein
MAVDRNPPYYRVYLLTVWQERSRDPTRAKAWRFRLEDPHTGKQRSFANANDLVTVLQEGLPDGDQPTSKEG